MRLNRLYPQTIYIYIFITGANMNLSSLSELTACGVNRRHFKFWKQHISKDVVLQLSEISNSSRIGDLQLTTCSPNITNWCVGLGFRWKDRRKLGFFNCIRTVLLSQWTSFVSCFPCPAFGLTYLLSCTVTHDSLWIRRLNLKVNALWCLQLAYLILKLSLSL